MDGGRNTWLRRKTLDIVVGIEAGVMGGTAMLVLLMLVAPLLGDSWWTYPNLFASHYYSRAMVRYGPDQATLSGIGLQIFWAGIVGAISGFLSPRGRHGVLVAMIWFLGCYWFIWRKYAPAVGIYGSAALLFASFVLYGSVLRAQGKLRRILEPSPLVPIVVSAPVVPDPAPAPVAEAPPAEQVSAHTDAVEPDPRPHPVE